MADAGDQLALVRTLRDQNQALERENRALKGGGGDGTSGGMEGRLGKLEAHMEHVQADLNKLSNVPTDLATVKALVDGLPTKDYLSAQLDKHLRNTGIVVAIIGGILGAAFKMIG